MKLIFFKKPYKLSHLQSEMLKVALLDSLRFANDDLTKFEQGTSEHDFLQNKIVLLDDLLKKLGLAYE